MMRRFAGYAVAKRTRWVSLLSALGMVGACSAPVSTDNEQEPQEAESIDEVAQALSYDCATSSDTGYTNGRATPITLVNVQGYRVEIATADAYIAMAEAAERAGIPLRINSGFRTNAEQQYLYNCYRNCNCNSCNLAAAPGYSNHQSGHALDLNTATGGVYNWLAANAASFGFKRTVPSEPWHWEWWGGGPGTTFCRSCDRSAGGFTFSCDGPNEGKTCVNVNESADPNSWADNFMCTDGDIGLTWSEKGPIEGMRCTNVHEGADDVPEAWADNYLCVPNDSEHVLEWSSAGPIEGKTCLQWNEPSDTHSWGDNYLCVSKTADFRAGVFTFSGDGPNEGQTCVSVDEPADPNTWDDNYLCSDTDLGIRWSAAGPIEGMRCTNIAESAEHDPAIWADNYLCLPEASPYVFAWSTAGKLPGQECVRWYEGADLGGSWADNYLCYTRTDGATDDGSGPSGSSAKPGSGAAAEGETDGGDGAGGCSVGAHGTPGKSSIAGTCGLIGLGLVLGVGRRRSRRR